MAEKKEVKKEGAPAGAAEGKSPKSQKARDSKKASRWDLKLCMKYAHRFESEEAWAHGMPSSYKAATARGFVADCTKHMTGGSKSKTKKKSA